MADHWLYPQQLAGWSDVDQNGIVDLADLSLLASNWNHCQ
jgi:hypothetical protein